MPTVVPHRFLFRYSIPIPRIDRLPRKGRKLLNLPAACELPLFDDLDGAETFGRIAAAWNKRGLAFSATARGKTVPPRCDRKSPAESDGLQLWIDTRNTQSIHRASRFCHHFCVLPQGAGPKSDRPLAVQLPIARAKEESALADPSEISVAAEKIDDGYRVEVWLPAEVLKGFDPDANPRLGFYYLLLDSELGEQFLSVGRDFPFAHDPSLWSTLELQSG